MHRIARIVLLSFVCAAPVSAADKPNVLFIFTDDQKFDTVGALGNEHVITPNLDRLAKRGFVFHNAYNFGGNISAVCVSSRNMVMTGQTWFRFNGGKAPRSDGKGPTLPKAFRAAGYETYYEEKSGKANLPTIQRQFDHYRDVDMIEALKTGYAARETIDRAIAFIEKDRAAGKPFFMYLGLPCPHDPRWAAGEFRDMYDPATLPLPPNYRPIHPFDMGDMTVRDERLEAWPRTEAAIRRHLFDYYALITSMDRDIGRLLDKLDELELTDRTIVVFSSDQGIAIGSHGLMGKQSIYEDVMKVPMIFAGPGIPAGESDALMLLQDVLPTLCEMIDAPRPGGIDGVSVADVVAGRTPKVRDTLMLAYKDVQRSIRDERWKIIRYPQINVTQLFDLQNDPHETTDLAGDPGHAPMIERLMKRLAAEQAKLGDKLPLTSDNPAPAAWTPPAGQSPPKHGGGGLAPGWKP